MRKTKSGGFTYIEALIAVTLVSLMMVPVFSGYYAAANNRRFSVDRYGAAVQAELALIDACRSYNAGGVFISENEFLRTDLYDFDFFFASGELAGAELIYINCPEIPVYEGSNRDIPNLSRYILTASGGSLTLEGTFTKINEPKAATVEVCGKEGGLPVRLGQVVR